METIIIHPKDKEELNFFLELAKRLGAKFNTVEDLQDEQLLQAMLDNANTEEVHKSNILNALNNILNEDQPPYKNED